MVTLGKRHQKKPTRITVISAKKAKESVEAARVSRAYLQRVKPGAKEKPGGRGGLKPGEYRVLQTSMEKVARMSESERAHLAQKHQRMPTEVQRRALSLRIGGMPYWQIADELGSDEATVTGWVVSQLQGLHGEEVRCADVARQLHLERLDALMSANWSKAMTGDVGASDIVLKCMTRASKLLGLDAPQRVDISVRLRALAEAEGLDYQELLAEANSVIRRLPPAK